MARSVVNAGPTVNNSIEHHFKHARSAWLRHCEFTERPCVNSINYESPFAPST